jgi:hypothetical protein
MIIQQVVNRWFQFMRFQLNTFGTTVQNFDVLYQNCTNRVV